MTNYYYAPKNAPAEIEFYGGSADRVHGPRIFDTYGLPGGGVGVDWECDKTGVLDVLRQHLNDPCVVDGHGTLLTGAQALAVLRDAAASEYEP